MRVLLINPFYPISETPSPPLGLAYIAAALERAGHVVEIRDDVVFPYTKAQLKKRLSGFAPRMVGVTAVSMNVDAAMAAIRDVRDLDPEILTVAGGPHVTFTAKQTLEAHPYLDAVVRGEGEATIVDLADAVASNRPFDTVPGIAFRTADGVRLTPDRPLIADLDALGLPARRLLPLGRYRALDLPVSMTTSRGCPFQCIFCVGSKMTGRRVRYRNPAGVVDELQSLAELGFKQINIADDLFTAKSGHCLAVCREIVRRGLKVKWTAFARVDTVHPEMLRAMERAGCTGVSFGLESGNRSILKTAKKGIVPEQAAAAVRMCRDAELAAYASFILGLPGETPDTLEETRRFAQRLEKMGLSYGYHLLAPFPGTEVRERAREFGIRILTDDWARYHANRAIVETETVSAAMLNRIAEEWKDLYDAYLGDIERRMKQGAISDAEALPLVSLVRTVTLYDLMMERVIEEHGRWAVNGGKRPSGGDALDMLVQKIRRAAGDTDGKIRDALTLAAERGDIGWTFENKQVRWQWTDRI